MSEKEVRLIDANAFYEKYKHYGLQNGTIICRHSGMAEYLLDELMKAHTIVPESLRPHGRWKKHKTIHGFVYCSNCKDVYLNAEWLVDGKWTFCPHCGAKMDKEE